MKFSSFSSKAIAIAAFTCVSGVAIAGGANLLTVNAKVSSKCTFNTATSTLDFGVIDPSLTTVANATPSSVIYRCTKGITNIAITPVGGLSRNLTSPSATIAYTLAVGSVATTGLGFGSGNDLTTTLNGSILATAYQNAPAETFTEVVTLNITP